MLAKRRILVQAPNFFSSLSNLRAGKGVLSIDTETNSKDARVADLCGVVIYCLDTKVSYYFSFGHVFTNNIPIDLVVQLWEAVSHRPHIYHNYKFDYKVLSRYGWEYHIHADTMIDASILNHSRSFNLESLCEGYGIKVTRIHSVVNFDAGQTMADVPATQVLDYACEDGELTAFLYLKEYEQIQAVEGLKRIQSIEMFALPAVIEMELRGINFSPGAMESIRLAYQTILDDSLSEFYALLLRLSDEPDTTVAQPHILREYAVNKYAPNSPRRFSRLLYEGFTVDPEEFNITKTKSGYSTSATNIERIPVDQYPILIPYLAFKEAQKALGQIKTYTGAVAEDTGCIHTSFLQVHVISGRMASSKPNLQQVPKHRAGRGTSVQGFRSAFVAPPGRKFLARDYSQVELRVLAALAKAYTMIDAFVSGVDIHTRTASISFGVSEALVSKVQRSQAKTVGFGLVYGMTPSGLAMRLNITLTQAEGIVNSFFKGIPEFPRYKARLIAQARRDLGVRTYFGRWIPIPDIASSNWRLRAKAERLAVNATIQGTAADVMKIALGKTMHGISTNPILADVQMHLCIHDEILLSIPDRGLDYTLEVDRELAKLMEFTLGGVPLVTDSQWGYDWHSLSDLQPEDDLPDPSPYFAIDVSALPVQDWNDLIHASASSAEGTMPLVFFNSDAPEVFQLVNYRVDVKLFEEFWAILDPGVPGYSLIHARDEIELRNLNPFI
jgi:DNA polymerase-1